MNSEQIDACIDTECVAHTYQMQDYEAGMPRWCKGCGDHAILSAVQRVLRDDQCDPESVVCVSGIGCSSRFPHYLKTYGFHGIHGRALPIATGVALSRPDLKVLTISGDGDCFSIGAGHWLHAIRYNVNLTMVVFDNEIYALTKKQASPTSRHGARSNTSPRGHLLQPLNPLTLMLGITNLSFLAQTATWLPTHMERTIRRAWEHKGLSFVRVLQYCPVFTPNVFGKAGQGAACRFLLHPEGISIEDALLRRGHPVEHNPRDLDSAQRIARVDDPAALGLLYWNPELPSYDEVLRGKSPAIDEDEYHRRLEALLDRSVIKGETP